MAIEFTAELDLGHHERAALADTCGTPGFKTVQKIFEAEVNKFFIALINIQTGGKEVIEGQRVAKIAAQLWEGASRRINAEIRQYTAEMASLKTEEPIDPIEGMIDLGPRASTQNSLEEGNELEY